MKKIIVLSILSFSLLSCLPRMVVDDFELEKGCWYGVSKKENGNYEIYSPEKFEFRKVENNRYIILVEGKENAFFIFSEQKVRMIKNRGIKIDEREIEIITEFDITNENGKVIILKNPVIIKNFYVIDEDISGFEVNFIRCDYFDTWKRENKEKIDD